MLKNQVRWHGITAIGTAVAAILTVAAAPAVAGAQSAGNGFLFEQPLGSVTLTGGYAHASAGGDLFSFVTKNLTLDKSAFSGPTFGAGIALRVAPRFDMTLDASYAGTSTPSHYRNLVDQNNAEIMQTTSFRRAPVMVGIRAYLTPQGRSIGQFAWVPARLAPYIGVGGGAVWYQFKQSGDFVDYQNNDSVFTSQLITSGWTPAAQGAAGVDFNLTPRLALTGEAKYLWARATPDQSFASFNTIDLSGLSATIGLTFRY